MSEKAKNQKGFLPIFIIVVILAGAIGLGITFGAIEYQKTSKSIEKAAQLTKEEKYNDAINLLRETQSSSLVRILTIKKLEIGNAMKEAEKLQEDKLEYSQGLEEFNKESWKKAKKLLSKVSESSPYYQEAKNKIEEAEKKIIEQQITEAIEKTKEEVKKEIEVVQKPVEKAPPEKELTVEELTQQVTGLEQELGELEEVLANLDYDISSAIGEIFCGEFSDSFKVFSRASGSLWKVNNHYWILTNEHVLKEPYSLGEHCIVLFVKDWEAAVEDWDKAFSEDKVLYYEIADTYTYSPIEGDDLAAALLEKIPMWGSKPLSLLEELALIPDLENCIYTYSIETPLKIYGYPEIGGETITVTEGIISSIEKEGETRYYLTSAKIDRGNSGGLAIVEEEETLCTAGIPTYVKAGKFETLGRILILTEEEIFQFLASITP